MSFIRPTPPPTPPMSVRGGVTGAGPLGPRHIRAPLRATTRALPRPGPIARRRFAVQFTKRVLPIAALAMLATIVLWPELSKDVDQHGASLRHSLAIPANGQMSQAAYHGIDERGRPYAITAETAREAATPGRIDMTAPKGDITMDGGRWLMVQSRDGTYMQHEGALDLYHDVVLYRDDGTTLRTDAADVDLHAGAAAGNDRTHVEGPMGQLDAQGFVLTDRGALIRFPGPGRLVLRAAEHTPSVVPQAVATSR